MVTKGKKESRMSRYIKAPIRVLSKARDFYIQSMSECAGQVTYGGGIGCPMPHVSPTLPRSFSVNSSRSWGHDNDDYRELVRAASTRSLGKKVQLPEQRQSPVGGVKVVPRSRSVAIGRIDEDKTCDFGQDVKVKPDIYPRSKSYAVSKRSTIL